jgi:hypothetical protein
VLKQVDQPKESIMYNGQIESFETSGPIEKKAECIINKSKNLGQSGKFERGQNV